MAGPTQIIARFAAASDAMLFPESARRVMKISLLDWCAVALAGLDEPVSRMVREMAGAEAGAPRATALGLPTRLPARAAALVNGATSHALDYDDTHFDYIGHPSVAIIPAALAIAEKTNTRGRDFLDAALVGVEAACRIGAWLGPAHYHHGFHQTSTSGAFGATAAAARLLGLNEDRTRHALGLTATRASGLKSQFGTMGKPYNAGMAAANGVECASLAALGFISRPDGIECEQGFGATHAGAGLDPATVFAGLGESFRFERVQHKFHACCHGTHATLEALIAARDTNTFKPDDIAEVTLFVHPHWLKVCDIPAPTTGLEAKFSYRLTSAMALSGLDTGALSTFTDALCANPALTSLRDRVRAEGDATLSDTAARARIELRSGVIIDQSHDLDKPLPIDTREAKARAKAAALLGKDKAEALWRAIHALDEGSTGTFATLLAGATRDIMEKRA
jgi:2-methylcitrate dehydratase PrpD